ncbi:MAG: TM2 domain-containing protein [Pseudomonadota bacterium]
MARYKNNSELVYAARSKSMLAAYLLWFFLGTLGLHRMYLERWISGILMLLFTAVGSALTFLLVGFLPLILVGIWWVLDGILTFMMVERFNERLARNL